LKSEYAGHVTGTNSHLEQAGGQEGHARLKERNTMAETETREELLKIQKALCKEKLSPMFMPGNGICWRCHKDITTVLAERMKQEVITGCPFCCRSYCD